MNNSKFAIDSISINEIEDKKPLVQEREAALIRILEAIGEIQKTEAWSTLKTELFDELPKRLRRELLREAGLENPNTNKLNRLTGELKWAEKFSDLTRLDSSLRVELQGIRQKLYGKE